MPRWDLHLACGISVTVLYLFCATLPFLGSGIGPIVKGIGSLALPILIGTLSLLVGSILPDIDGKGRIRWIIGPVVGSFALILMTLRAFIMDGAVQTISYLADDGALVFLGATVLGYGSLLLPMRHRGIMHRIPSALAFSLVCAVLFMLALDPGYEQVALVGTMAFSGYGWHLALDGTV